MSYSTGNRGGGRRSYGTRGAATARPTLDDKAVWERHANSLGVSLGSWLIIVANKAIGLELPDFIQEELYKVEAKKYQPKLELEGLPTPSYMEEELKKVAARLGRDAREQRSPLG